jgi:hypothetical protein
MESRMKYKYSRKEITRRINNGDYMDGLGQQLMAEIALDLLSKSTKQIKLTGKDNRNLPNTKNKAKAFSSEKVTNRTPIIPTRPKPNKIEKIEVRALGGDVEFDVISFSKINKIIQVINYLLEKEK